MSATVQPSVLFVCVKNGGKSQMAAALMRRIAGDTVDVYSAGTKPGSALNTQSVEVLTEYGASTEGEYPKPIDEEVLRRVDRVIVLGSEAAVSPVDGMRAEIETWETVEPSERGVEGLDRMREIRSDIAARVESLHEELTQAAG